MLELDPRLSPSVSTKRRMAPDSPNHSVAGSALVYFRYEAGLE